MSTTIPSTSFKPMISHLPFNCHRNRTVMTQDLYNLPSACHACFKFLFITTPPPPPLSSFPHYLFFCLFFFYLIIFSIRKRKQKKRNRIQDHNTKKEKKKTAPMLHITTFWLIRPPFWLFRLSPTILYNCFVYCIVWYSI